MFLITNRRYTYYEDGLTLIKELDMSVKDVWLRENLDALNVTDKRDYQVC